MNWDDIVEFLEQGEGQSVEFEKSITTAEDIARELVAFSNSDGGKIIFGIDDKNKHFYGVATDDNFKNWILEIGTNNCSPAIKTAVDLLDKDGKTIAVISVAEGDEKPYYTDDICYIRDGSSSRPAKAEEEEEIKSPWSGIGLNRRQKKALQYISEHGSITNREYRDLFKVSHKTAHLELTLLTDKGLTRSQGMGRSTRYILPPSPTL
jgi:predicted HTH transcriptional regulator